MKKALITSLVILLLLFLSSCENEAAEVVPQTSDDAIAIALGYDHHDELVIVPGRAHHMVLDQNNALWGWGSNRFGELGDGTNINRSSPVLIMENVAAVYAYDFHTTFSLLGISQNPYDHEVDMRTFVITNDGNLYGWGMNEYGQLGDGTTTDSNMPVRIMENIASVYPSYFNTFAITIDGVLYAWGRNAQFYNSFFMNGYFYALGDGTMYDRLTPVRIMENVASMYPSHIADTNFLITTDGILYGWGSNDEGRLGDGTDEHSLSPVRIMENITTVYNNGMGSIFAMTTDGALYSWGAGFLGGNDAFGHGKTPVRVMENVRCFDYNNSLVLLKDDSLWLLSPSPFEPIEPYKIMDSVSAFTIGERGVISVRLYVITTDGSLVTWVKVLGDIPPTNENDPSYTPMVILDDVVSVYPGSRWRIRETLPQEYLDELNDLFSGADPEELAMMSELLELQMGITLPINAGNGSYSITSDRKLWRIGNHEPYVVMESVMRFYSSLTEINIALLEDGSIWTWSDNWRHVENDSYGTRQNPVRVEFSTESIANIEDIAVASAPEHQPLEITGARIAAGTSTNFVIQSDGSLWACAYVLLSV